MFSFAACSFEVALQGENKSTPRNSSIMLQQIGSRYHNNQMLRRKIAPVCIYEIKRAYASLALDAVKRETRE
jgi:hypothetical protein